MLSSPIIIRKSLFESYLNRLMIICVAVKPTLSRSPPQSLLWIITWTAVKQLKFICCYLNSTRLFSFIKLVYFLLFKSWLPSLQQHLFCWNFQCFVRLLSCIQLHNFYHSSSVTFRHLLNLYRLRLLKLYNYNKWCIEIIR